MIKFDFVCKETIKMSVLEDISSFLQKGRAKQVQALVQQALDEGLSPKQILEEGLLAGMGIIGGKFKNNEVFVPEVLVAARTMNKGAAILKPYLVADGVEERGTVVIGAVKGDLHDIGKNLVKMMMEGKGLKVVDLGVDIKSEEFVQAARENNAGIIACAALLTTTMEEMKGVVDAARSAGIAGLKVMVGGAPVTQEYADLIGADAYGEDAASAADKALELCTA